MDTTRADAEALLRRLTGHATADFHDGQWEAIDALANQRHRALVVQRTGWGKSAVYFIATRLLRDQGTGPTLLLSPLLALMRNQIDAAARVGLQAESINSGNTDEWTRIQRAIDDNEVDLLLISAQRLANPDFQRDVLPVLGQRSGLLVIDEAHCISDWGHDFNPDYRRIGRVLDLLPRGVPVLACTATANDRVVTDIEAQLSRDLVTIRGPLARDGLSLHVLDIPSQPERMAWLAQTIPTLEGSGIVYCLTVADAERVAAWLRREGVDAHAYTGATDNVVRVELEQRLLANDLKVLVPRARSAWASTSRTSPSSSTTSHPVRRCTTTNRSAEPVASSTSRSACCLSATKTPTCRTGSSPPRSRSATMPKRS